MDATREVEKSVMAIQSGVGENVEGMDKAASAAEGADKLAARSGEALNQIRDAFAATVEQVTSIADDSANQSSSGDSIRTSVMEVDTLSANTVEAVTRTGNAVHDLVDQIAALGRLHGMFALLGEGDVQQDVEQLGQDSEVASMEPERQRAALKRALRRNPLFELAWVTDAAGRQTVDFVAAADAVCLPDAVSCGKDWSSRDWFTEVLRTGQTHLSNIYYSETVGNYCLTVAVPIESRDGRVVGVLGVDIRPPAREDELSGELSSNSQRPALLS
jgi:hypothetical protein